MIGLTLVLVLAQPTLGGGGESVTITNPTNPAKRVTTTTSGGKELLDVNCPGCSGGGGGSSVVTIDGGSVTAIQGLAADGGFPWDTYARLWDGTTKVTVTVGSALKTDSSATTQPVSNSGLSNIDVALSTRTKPSDQQHVIVDTVTPTVTVAQPTAANLNATVTGTVTTSPPSNASTNVTQFGSTNISTGTGTSGAGIPRVTVSSDSFPATQPVSAASLPLPTGAATSANQTTLGNQTTKINDGTDTALVSGSGSLQVTCDNCGGSTFSDNSAFTYGTSTVLNQGNVVDDVNSTAVTEDSAGIPRMSSNRVAYNIIRDGTGMERGAAVTANNALVVDEVGPVSSMLMPSPWATFAGPLVAQSSLGLLVRNLPTGTQTVNGNVGLTDGFSTATIDPTQKTVHVTQRPFEVLGVYEASSTTGAYTGLGANSPLVSFRWGTNTGALAVILKVKVLVTTTTSATAAGMTERQLIIARNFTASDTGGTALTISGNDQKRRTSQKSSLVTDLRFGNPVTAGTRTLDNNPISTVIGWSGLLSTGIVIGAAGSSPVGAARSTEGGVGLVPLLDATSGTEYPIVLAQNEGFIIRIGVAQPTSVVQQTTADIVWAEVMSY